MIGRWGNQKPQNYVCLAKCHSGHELSGSYLSVCRVPTNSWIVPPAAWCHGHLPHAKYCKTPSADNGYYVCEDTGGHGHGGHAHGGHGHGGHGRKRRADEDRGQGHGGHGYGGGHGNGGGHTHVVHHGLLKCNLRCNPGFRPVNGRWTARCDQNNGLWQIPSTHCVQEVKTCMDVPSINNGNMNCEAPHIHSGAHYGQGDSHTHNSGHGHRSEDEETTETSETSKTTETSDVVEEAKTTASPALSDIKIPVADASTLIGASGSCAIEPARNTVKGGALVCRQAADGNVMCMIMCDEDFRPWHGELIIYCRDNVFYNRNNPLEVQKNMKCKEAPCDVEKYGIACYNHANNRERRNVEFTEALSRSNRAAGEIGGTDENRGNLHWHDSSSRKCNVKCNDGYEIHGSNMAVCNYKTGTWELTPGTCKEVVVEKNLGCVAPQSSLDFGKWKCKLTSDEGDMRGEGTEAITEEEAAAFAEYNTETMALVTERGMWELVPGFDDARRKRRDSNAKWNMQLARYASEQYLVCWMACKDGYEPKDLSLNKIGCRMSDAKWIKPYKKSVHSW